MALRSQLAEAEAQLVVAEADLAQRHYDLAVSGARIDELLGTRDTSVAEVASALTQARDLAVAAYVRGDVGPMEYLVDATGAADLAWRQSLTVDQVSGAQQAATRLVTLRELVDVQTLEQAELLDHAQRLRGEAVQRVDALHRRVAQLRTDIEAADLAAEQARRVAARRAEAQQSEQRWGTPPQYGLRSEPTAEHWRRLRFCEATGNYGAVSPSGLYRGAYQFDRQTWMTMGGTGDPAAAPAPEQDARARALYQARGSQPWPVCGRFLP